jgi:hypothetical protein
MSMIQKPPYPRLAAGHPIARDLLVYLPCSEGQGNRLNDISPLGVSGSSYFQGGAPSWAQGKFGAAVEFNGSTDSTNGEKYLASLMPHDVDLTVAAWCYHPSTDYTGIWTITKQAGAQYVKDHGNASVHRCYSWDGVDLPNQSASFARSTATWYFFVWQLSFRSSGWTYEGFVDGASKGTDSGAEDLDFTGQLWLYQLGRTNNQFANVRIELFGIWLRLLDATEIKRLYTEPLTLLQRPSLPALFSGFSPGNDFSRDINCMALYRFESGNLTVDSKGGNTLTASGSPTSDTSDYKEGDGSVDLEPTGGNDYFSCSDANLDNGFPYKNGDTKKNLSVAGWVKPEQFGTGLAICSKSSAVGGSFDIYITSGGILTLAVFGGGSWQSYAFGTAMSVDKWYHVAITYKWSDAAYRIRVWDYDAGALLDSDTTGNGTKNVSATTDPFYVGTSGAISRYYDGWIDELVIFNDLLNVTEIDEIRQGIYNSKMHTRGDEDVLPGSDDDLETDFTLSDYDDVETDNAVRVAQTATDENAIFQFKKRYPRQQDIYVKWNGQTDLAPTSSTVYLQVYNRRTAAWENIDSDSVTGADTDFDLSGTISTNLDDYFDANFWISARVYQEAI